VTPRRLVVIVGPTASGKSELALRLADAAAPAEIVSADSQQVYRGMDIGTGKVGPEERARVPHHLLDVVTPDVVMTAARYAALADQALAGIAGRGAAAIVVGGTGLYVRALLHGLFQGPGAAPELRARLEGQGAAALHARLAAVDPRAAERIGPADLRRLVRALEVYELTGVPMSVHQEAHDVRRSPRRYEARLVGLDPPRDELRRRIDQRVDAMLAAGLVAEVRALVAAHPGGARALDAIGYREIAAHLRGELGLSQAAEAIKGATRRYARRQLGWFRAEQGVTWYKSDLDVETTELAAWLRAEGA
jgi:tRNA dimethylallyltransferase